MYGPTYITHFFPSSPFLVSSAVAGIKEGIVHARQALYHCSPSQHSVQVYFYALIFEIKTFCGNSCWLRKPAETA